MAHNELTHLNYFSKKRNNLNTINRMDDTKLYFNFMSSDANSLAYLASYNLI
jgi:hypothetical protein